MIKDKLNSIPFNMGYKNFIRIIFFYFIDTHKIKKLIKK